LKCAPETLPRARLNPIKTTPAATGIMVLDPLWAAIRMVKTKKRVPINSARYFFMHFSFFLKGKYNFCVQF
jgi:hypothetical protein